MHTPVGPSSRLDTAGYDYPLPEDRIAQRPLPERDASRLLVVGGGAALMDHVFTDLPGLLQPGDLLVANHTRVRAARLRAVREGGAGGAVELLILERGQGGAHVCLVRPARRLREGARLSIVGGELSAEIGGVAPGHPGARWVRFAGVYDIDAAVERVGELPLPPYIRQPIEDPARYQTVYACGTPVSAAAPTAGLHMTTAVRAALAARGVEWASVRLDVGLGTFAPIRVDRIDHHVMHQEWCEVPESAAMAVAACRRRGGRVIAVGTTVLRTLETHARGDGTVVPGAGRTSLYLRPGSQITTADGLLTNFHQPRSSLLVLLAAFAGESRWRAAYDHALRGAYRFLSFGDCMLCWREARG